MSGDNGSVVSEPPETGQQTGVQTTRKGGGTVSIGSTNASVMTQRNVPGRPKNVFDEYRQIAKNPTIALGTALLRAPIVACRWGYESDEGTPEDRTEFVKTEIDPLMPCLLRDMFRSVQMGFSPFERVWAMRSSGLLGYDQMKALIPDKTQPMVAQTGELVGLKNGDVTLPRVKMFWYTFDQDYDNYFGNPLYENVRTTAWPAWVNIGRGANAYLDRAAGAQPIVFYPPGESKDASGTLQENYRLADRLLEQLSLRQGITVPRDYDEAMEELIQSGADFKELIRWTVDYLEPKNKHGDEFINASRYQDSLLLRGILVPERAAIEGDHGTKAEAEAHGELLVSLSATEAQNMFGEINQNLIDDMLQLNFGVEARGTVRLIQAGLDPTTAALLRDIIKAVLGNPANISVALDAMDLRSTMDITGVPQLNPSEPVTAEAEVQRVAEETGLSHAAAWHKRSKGWLANVFKR